MSNERLAKWNARFRERPDAPGAPERWIVEHLDVFPRAARILDLACGDGRNAITLAARGFSVVAVDFSPAGLERLHRFAARAGVEVETRREDLDTASALQTLGPVEGVVISHYKPSSWEPVVRFLRRPGHVVVCALNEEEHVATGFPLAFCLRPQELWEVPGLRVLEYRRFVEEGRHLDGYVLARA